MQQPPNHHEREQILYQSTISDPRTFNPILVTDSASGEVVGDLFEGLVRINPITTLPEPGLAESWELERWRQVDRFPSASRREMVRRRAIHRARRGLHDARDLRPARSQYRRAQPHRRRQAAQGRGPGRLHGADDDAAAVRAAALRDWRSDRARAPARDALDAGKFNHTWGINTPPEKIVGLGQFEMARYVQAQFVHFKRNPDYWMRDENGERLPRLHGETLQIVPDGNAAVPALSRRADRRLRAAPRGSRRSRASKQKQLGITLKEIGIDTGSLFFAFNRNPRHYIHNGVTDPKYRLVHRSALPARDRPCGRQAGDDQSLLSRPGQCRRSPTSRPRTRFSTIPTSRITITISS